MKLHAALICLVIITSLSSCFDSPKQNSKLQKSPEKKSRVLEFDYGGYDDTVYALIGGVIYERDTAANSKDTLHPLPNVSIKVEQNGKIDWSDTKGQFELGLDKGIFSFLITKEGSQSLLLTNSISDPDQISGTKIVLEKGSGLQTFKIPNSKK